MTNHHHPLKVIERLGLSTASVSRAVTKYGERNYSIRTHLANAKEITGGEYLADNVKVAAVIAKYSIQLTLEAFQDSEFPDMDSVAAEVRQRTATLIDTYPMFVKEYNSSDGGSPETPSKQRSTRGGWIGSVDIYLANKDILTRLELIDKLMADLELSSGTATAYFYKLKAEYGYTPKEGEKTRSKKT